MENVIRDTVSAYGDIKNTGSLSRKEMNKKLAGQILGRDPEDFDTLFADSDQGVNPNEHRWSLESVIFCILSKKNLYSSLTDFRNNLRQGDWIRKRIKYYQDIVGSKKYESKAREM